MFYQMKTAATHAYPTMREILQTAVRLDGKVLYTPDRLSCLDPGNGLFSWKIEIGKDLCRACVHNPAAPWEPSLQSPVSF